MKFKSFPFFHQLDQMDCAPTCLKMIATYYGKSFPMERLRELCSKNREGVSLLALGDAANELGFIAQAGKITTEEFENMPLPSILFWNQAHFVVLYKLKRSKTGSTIAYIADPANGKRKVTLKDLSPSFFHDGKHGIAMLLEPTKKFYSTRVSATPPSSLFFLYHYIRPYRKSMINLCLGMFISSLIALSFPFLQTILVDKGIQNHQGGLIYIILVAQLALYTSDTLLSIFRSWLLLHVNMRISLKILSDFLQKLLKLPIRYFDSKSVGDLTQRIGDHQRIEGFLTNETIHSIFSIVNIVLFTCILGFFDTKILLVFLGFSVLGVMWAYLFNNKRKEIDHQRFHQGKLNSDKLVEMMHGMQEIKLYGSEEHKKNEWEVLQVDSFKIRSKSLSIFQLQNTGFQYIMQLKNILCTCIAAQATVGGTMTMGQMLSIAFIIGQTNGPLEQLIDFMNSAQDARLSMDRLQEIQSRDNENDTIPNETEIMPIHNTISVENISFRYDGKFSPAVIDNLSFKLPKGKVTAIVGSSGSGKTTLLKVLLKIYPVSSGAIYVGDEDLSEINPIGWRNQCGTVMQDGYIFHDTILNNIVLDGNAVDKDRLDTALHIANLTAIVNELPLGLTTKIGISGMGLSGGQLQRVLIARAVYKNPNYLFFDEATSALDATNERQIMNKLHAFFEGKTVIIVAHRLSTVVNADNVIVLDKGKIVEQGTHLQLVENQGAYFRLVKNQLELSTI